VSERKPTTAAIAYAARKEHGMNLLGTRRLFFGLVIVASLLFGAFAGSASAAPALHLHTVSPQTFEPGEKLDINIAVENIGDAAYTSPITVETIFPEGIEPVPGGSEIWGQTTETVISIGNESPWECSLAGRTSTCTVTTFNPLTGEGILPGAEFEIHYFTAAEPTASGTLVQKVQAEGGGAFEPVTQERTMRVGPPEPFGFRRFSSAITNKDGSSAVQAGSSPGSITTSLEATSRALTVPFLRTLTVPTEQFKTTVAHVPPGLIGNPNATPEKCTVLQLNQTEYGSCPPDSQVGTARVFFSSLNAPDQLTFPLFNMVTPPGVPAQFGFTYQDVPTVLRAELRPDYGLDIVNRLASTTYALSDIEITFWGVPADPSHDTRRGSTYELGEGELGGCLGGRNLQLGRSCPAGYPPTAFLRLPTSCPEHPLSWEIEMNSYLHPDTWARATTTTPAPVGCNQLDFTPTMEARPTTNVGDAPSGLDFHLHLPQNDDPDGLAEANLKDAVVTLPPGMTVNPASANGLGACGPAQIGLTTATGQTPIRFTLQEAECPDQSRLGSVEIETPVIDHPLHGSVYLATPFDNPYHALIALYFEVVDTQSGIVVKIPARVSPDPKTGQLKAIVEETPQLPFEDFRLSFDPGPHASLRTPATCGDFTSRSVMTPWTSPEGADATPSDSFQIVKGANGGGCSSSDSQLPHKVSFSAGTLNPKGGAYSPFAFKITRADGTQELRSIDTTLPPGLLARLIGVRYCYESEIAAAVANSGKAEQASPSCPASSRVGGVNVGAGAGPSPFFASGNIYLAGPYKGAPYSVAVVVPAVAGPFDLGTVVTRVAIYVDPVTTQVHVVSDPFPTILQGIPLDVRSIAVNLDREQFTINPTSCNPMAVTGMIGSVFGQNLNVSNPFQVGGCQDLGFKPKLTLTLKGGTKRSQHPQLRAVLKERPGDAHISRAQVTLPHSEFLDQGHLRNICTRVQFAAHQCPASSIYGYAKTVSPLLAQPLEGPVYLRSSSHPLPDLVAALGGEIEVELGAIVGTGKNQGLRTTFDMVPDAPATEFVLTMKGGKKGLLVNSTDICRRPHTVNALFEAHNGKTADQTPVLRASGCKKAKRHGRHSKKSR
jgi:hypothetical protein